MSVNGPLVEQLFLEIGWMLDTLHELKEFNYKLAARVDEIARDVRGINQKYRRTLQLFEKERKK